jgi:hypothetical protein
MELLIAFLANVDDLLGFQVADLRTGQVISPLEVPGFGWSKERIKHHRCPSHGIALSTAEKETLVDSWSQPRMSLYRRKSPAIERQRESSKSRRSKPDSNRLVLRPGADTGSSDFEI